MESQMWWKDVTIKCFFKVTLDNSSRGMELVHTCWHVHTYIHTYIHTYTCWHVHTYMLTWGQVVPMKWQCRIMIVDVDKSHPNFQSKYRERYLIWYSTFYIIIAYNFPYCLQGSCHDVAFSIHQLTFYSHQSAV